MDWRHLSFDPLTGMHKTYGYDNDTGQSFVRYDQDCQNVLDVCREDNNHADRSLKKPMVHVAEVPASIQVKWLVEHGVDLFNPDHKGAVHRLLDGDYKHLKRLPITIGNY